MCTLELVEVRHTCLCFPFPCEVVLLMVLPFALVSHHVFCNQMIIIINSKFETNSFFMHLELLLCLTYIDLLVFEFFKHNHMTQLT